MGLDSSLCLGEEGNRLLILRASSRPCLISGVTSLRVARWASTTSTHKSFDSVPADAVSRPFLTYPMTDLKP